MHDAAKKLLVEMSCVVEIIDHQEKLIQWRPGHPGWGICVLAVWAKVTGLRNLGRARSCHDYGRRRGPDGRTSSYVSFSKLAGSHSAAKDHSWPSTMLLSSKVLFSAAVASSLGLVQAASWGVAEATLSVQGRGAEGGFKEK